MTEIRSALVVRGGWDGQGRVFVCTAGHKLNVLDEPSVRTIVERGLLWASR